MHTYIINMHTYILMLVSICNQIIIRPREEIADTDGVGHVLNGACNLHRSISIHKKCAPKTKPDSSNGICHV